MEFKRAPYWSKSRDRTKQSVRGNLYKYRKKTVIFGKFDISNKEDFCHQLYFSLP